MSLLSLTVTLRGVSYKHCLLSLFHFSSFRCMHSVISVYLSHAIMLTRPCDLDPCKPIFHIVKIGTGITLFDIDCLIEAVLMFLCLEQNLKKKVFIFGGISYFFVSPC